MKKSEILTLLNDKKLIAVVRGNNKEEAQAIVDGCIDGGIIFIEATLTNPDALEIIKEYSNYENIIIGAGTVLTKEDACECIKAGAKFIVSPCYLEDLVDYVVAHDIIMISGGITPTEMYQGFLKGADLIKLFPCDAFSTNYMKGMKGPFPFMNIVPTGGINSDNLKEWIDAGAYAIGLGSFLSKGDDTLYHNTLKNVKKCIQQMKL